MKKGYQDFHAPKWGGEGAYTDATVVTSVYDYIDKQTDGIDRHEDMEQRAETERFTLIAYCLELSGVCCLSVHFGSFHFGSFRLSD